jgi:dihydroorotate dehydrogenase
LNIYKNGLRPLLFSVLKAEPERLHQGLLSVLHWLAVNPQQPATAWVKHFLELNYGYHHDSLKQEVWGIPFGNPLGLAAGFDKDGMVADGWSSFGFGFAELGTVTLQAQPGNPKPRLFRLPVDQAALNRMGFNNQGASAMATRLQQRRSLSPSHSSSLQLPLPLGINLGKLKATPTEAAAIEYRDSFRLLQAVGDYFVVNVSSPNTPGLRSLQAADQLALILKALQEENQSQKPILVKIAPDLEWEAIAELVALAQTHHLSGIIATNTTIRRDDLQTQILTATGKPLIDEPGGISGAPLRQRATEVIRFIYRETAGRLPIIGVGGIFTADHAWEKIAAGASLIQVYTGWFYEGPGMVRHILQGLVQKLEERGMAHIQEAVGSEIKA